MTQQAYRALAFFGAMGALVIVAGVVGLRLLGGAAGPEAAIFGALKGTEDETLQVPIAGAPQPLELTRVFYQRITVQADLEARTAEATATLDAEGRFGKTKVSSLGLERISFVYRDYDWTPSQGFAPRLAAIVSAVEARRRALEAGDVSGLAKLAQRTPDAVRDDPEVQRVFTVRGREYRVKAWYIRSAVGGAEVREEYHLTGDTPDRPVDERGARLFRLKEERGEFFFASGLM